MNIYELLSRDNFITVNKILMKKVGMECAVLLSELCYRRQYLARADKLQEDGYFYATVESVEDATTLSEHLQRKHLNTLQSMGIVKFERRGLPSKRFIYIDEQALNELLSSPAEDKGQVPNTTVPDDIRDCTPTTSGTIINNNINNNKSSTPVLSKDNTVEKIGRKPARSSKTSGSLLGSTSKKSAKNIQKKINSFITSCEREMNTLGFSEDVKTELSKFFRMLGESESLLPSTSIHEQLKLLQALPEDKRAEIVRETVSHGWKNLKYCIEQYQQSTTPSWDTAVPGSFRPKTEEEKAKDIFEGASPEEIF